MFEQPIQEIQREINDIEAGRISGWTTGFEELDRNIGRLNAGQIFVVGGYSGTGKSFVILNMIDGILKEWATTKIVDYKPPKIAVFSTELNVGDYIRRHIFMRAGIYSLMYQKEPARYKAQVEKELVRYKQERIFYPESLQIYGNISYFEQIEKAMSLLKVIPNIIYIDYTQELSINGKYDLKDIMPILAQRIKRLAIQYKVAVVCVSQLNNYSMNQDQSKTQLMPFSFGKELMQAAHAAILLTREKENGILQPQIAINVIKARDGTSARLNYDILLGYKLKYAHS